VRGWPVVPSAQMAAEGASAHVVRPSVVVHCFRALGPPNAEGAPEVPLSPALCFLEAAVGLHYASNDIVFVESATPDVGALGYLPAGYVDGLPARNEVLVHLVRHALLKKLAESAADGGETSDVRSRAARIECVLSRVVDAVLWAHRPCYRNHTLPAMRRAAGLAGPLLVASHCWRKRAAALAAEEESPWVSAFAAFQALVLDLSETLEDNCFFSKARPQLDDLLLFAHMDVLVHVRPDLLPWHGDPQAAWMEAYESLLKHHANFDRLLEVHALAIERGEQCGQRAVSGLQVSWPGPDALVRLDVSEDGELDDEDGDGGVVQQPSWAMGDCTGQTRWPSVARRPPELVPARGSSQKAWMKRNLRPKDTGSAGVAGNADDTSKPGAAPASDDEGGTEDGDPRRPISAVQWRTNAVFITWCAVSMGAFALLSLRKAQQS